MMNLRQFEFYTNWNWWNIRRWILRWLIFIPMMISVKTLVNSSTTSMNYFFNWDCQGGWIIFKNLNNNLWDNYSQFSGEKRLKIETIAIDCDYVSSRFKKNDNSTLSTWSIEALSCREIKSGPWKHELELFAQILIKSSSMFFR